MELKTFFAQDLSGNVIPSPTVDVYQPGTTTRVTGLQTATGAALSNPFTGTSTGQITLAAPDGTYDLAISGGGRAITMRVRFVDVDADSVAAAAASALSASENASGAQADRIAAQAARDAAFVNADVYTSIAAAQDDAGLANGQQYQIVSADGLTMLRYRKDSSSTSTPMASYPTASAAMLTSGNIFATTATVAELFGGAVSVSVDGRVVGFTIPAGQTGAIPGAGSYVGAEIPSTSMREKTVRLIQRYQATAGWMSAVSPLGGVVVQSRSASATTNLTPTSFSREQVGTEIVQICTCVVPVDSLAIRQVMQVNSKNLAESSDQTIQIVGVAYQVVSDTNATQTIADAALAQRMEWINPAISAAVAPVTASVNTMSSRIDQNALTSGNVLGTATSGQSNSEAFNGAAITTTSGVTSGFSIPADDGTGTKTGVNTYVTRFFDGTTLVGKTIDITAKYTVSENFLASCPAGTNALQVRIGGVVTTISETTAARAVTQDGTKLIIKARYAVPAGTTDIGVLYQVRSTSIAQAFVRSITIDSIGYQLGEEVGKTTNDVMLDQRMNVALAEALDGVVSTTTVIQAGPTRTYTTPKLANDAVVNATATARTEIQLDAGTYSTDPEGWSLAHYATLKGYGANTPVIHYAGADGATHADLETMWIRRDGTLENVKVTGRNVRYAIHAESGSPATATKDCKVTIKNSWIEHLGNVNNNWSTQSAWGSGISSGWHVRSENNIYRAPFSAFFYHTNGDFEKPTLVENIGDTFINTGASATGTAIELQPMGTKQRDQHRIIGCTIDGVFRYNVYLWLYTTIDYQPANHCEIESSGYGNTPAVFRVSDFGRALRIRAIAGAGSSVVVSGDAVPVIFGTARSFPGVENLPAYVDGTFDISGTGVGLSSNIFITSLGKRLGNCTSVNKTLTVTINGGTPTSIVFNQDYTNVDNATIIAAIQGSVGATSLAVVDTYAPGELYHPRLTDEERTLYNQSATIGIPKGSVLAFDGSRKFVRLMTSSDAASLFAGVALEDIYPLTFGRVKTRGWLWLPYVRMSPGALTFGATMSVGATPGRVDAGGSQGLLRAVRTEAVEVAP